VHAPPSEPAKSTQSSPTKSDLERQQLLIEDQDEVPPFQPPVTVVDRGPQYRDPLMISWSPPIRLFMYLISPVLHLLLIHTNLKAERDHTRKKAWKPLTALEIRRWVAVRLEMARELSVHAPMASFWSQDHISTTSLSRGSRAGQARRLVHRQMEKIYTT
jgi:hypothetical protein